MARTDELDAIEEEVDRLRRAVASAEAEEARVRENAEASFREYGNLVADTATGVARQLDEIRMPLYILLENRFGDLNENQGEMLAAARSAADDAQAYLERLREIADADRGALRLRADRVRLGDLVSALMPGIASEGERHGVTVRADLSPILPDAAADRTRLSEAVSLLAMDAVHRTPDGGQVRLVAADPDITSPSNELGDSGSPIAASTSYASRRQAASVVQLVFHHGGGPARNADEALARRLIAAMGGRVDYEVDRTTITVPATRPEAATSVVTPPSDSVH